MPSQQELRMAGFKEVSPQQLARLVGLPDQPVIVDVRTTEDFNADPRLIPGSIRRDHRQASHWAPSLAGQRVVVQCQKGLKLSQGAAAWLRHAGAEAETLEGGFLAWAKAGLPLVPMAARPAEDDQGRSLWVTRARPKVDRIACPWLIRRFIDARAVFLFVAPGDVADVADRFCATPFDIEGVHWSHRGPLCTFDVMLREWGLETPALLRLATIVRGADTAAPDLAPEAAGLLAISLGLSRMYRDDLAQLDAGCAVYDALYRWCRDATDETHNWPAKGA
jgi:rhodanese-related sulfurtransferase